MPKFLVHFVVAFSLFMGVAHADKYDDAMKEYVVTLDEFKVRMTAIKDVKSAEAGEAKLVETVKRFAALKKRLVDIGSPNKERSEALKAAYGDKVKVAMTDLFAQMSRVSKIKEVRPVMERVMEHIN